MAIAGALQVNTMLEELDLGETDQVMDIIKEFYSWYCTATLSLF